MSEGFLERTERWGGRAGKVAEVVWSKVERRDWESRRVCVAGLGLGAVADYGAAETRVPLHSLG